jgi:GAF domain-containing protein
MIAWGKRLLAAPVFPDAEQTRVARLLNLVLWIYLGIVFLYGIASVFYPAPWLTVAFVAVAALFGFFARFLMQKGYVQGAGLLFSGALWVFMTAVCVLFGGVNGPAFFGYVVVTMIAGLFLGGRAGFLFAVLSVAAGLGMISADRAQLLPQPLVPRFPVSELLALSTYVGMAAAILYLLTSGLARALEQAGRNEHSLAESNRELQAIRASLEDRVSARTQGLRAAAEVSKATASVLDLDELLVQVVNLVRERFDLYYVGVFLVDEAREWAVLVAGTGEAGRQMLAIRHRLDIGGRSMIGQCVARNEARIALDVGGEAFRFDNPMLPDTRSEIALPLRWHDEVIGALTVQSDVESAFDEADVAVLQIVVDQMAVAIRNAQLFTELQGALTRSDTMARRYVQESWDHFVQMAGNVTGYRFVEGRAEQDNDAWLPIIQKAVQHREVIAEPDSCPEDGSAAKSLAVPLTYGGEIIGGLGLKRSGPDWDGEEVSLIRAVGEQVAQAVERMRLLDQTRQSAQRETILRRTTDRVRAQANLDAVLRVAAQELQRVTRATRVSIRLGTEDLPVSSSVAASSEE